MTKDGQTDNMLLLAKIRDGDGQALEELVDANMGLVKKIALRFIGRGVEYEDLTQIGVIGMIKAARSFDFSFCTAFSTYAVPLIMGEIRRFLRDDGPIKVGRSQKQKSMLVMQASERIMAKNGREAHLSELASETGMTVEEVSESLAASAGVISLSTPLGDENGATLENTLADESGMLSSLTERIALAEALKKLPPLWQDIIKLRYFSELSQVQTAERLGLTQVKVSREEKKILLSLRKELG